MTGGGCRAAQTAALYAAPWSLSRLRCHGEDRAMDPMKF